MGRGPKLLYYMPIGSILQKERAKNNKIQVCKFAKLGQIVSVTLGSQISMPVPSPGKTSDMAALAGESQTPRGSCTARLTGGLLEKVEWDDRYPFGFLSEKIFTSPSLERDIRLS